MLVPLKSVRVENFRGFRRLALNLHPKVTVLFGSNAAGKTSVIDALAIGLGTIVSRIPKSSSRTFAKTGDLRVPWLDRPEANERAGQECAYSRVVVEGAKFTWETRKLRSVQDRGVVGPRIDTIMLNSYVDAIVKVSLELSDGEPVPPLPLLACYGNERALVDVPLRERSFNKEFQRFGGLDRALKATTRFKTVFEWFRVMEDEERRARERLRDFDFRLPALEWVRRAVDKAELRCSNPRVETQPIRMKVDFEHEDGTREALDISSLSDGYRTHFSLVVDLARRMVQLNPSDDLSDPERGTNSAAVVLIDEVDLHLDPAWQARVVRGLVSAFPNTQFVLTTHSEQVLGSVEAESVRKLVWREGEIGVETVPFAQGATGERILIDHMNAPERVPGPITTKLLQYVEFVESGKGDSQQASSLREELDQALPGEPLLHQADLEMQRRRLLDEFSSL